MGDPFDLERARERRGELLREAEERRIAGAMRRARRGVGDRPLQRRSIILTRIRAWSRLPAVSSSIEGIAYRFNCYARRCRRDAARNDRREAS